MTTVMNLIKKKNPTQVAFLSLALGRLKGLDTPLFQGGEPMLSIKLASIIREIEIVLDTSEILPESK